MDFDEFRISNVSFAIEIVSSNKARLLFETFPFSEGMHSFWFIEDCANKIAGGFRLPKKKSLAIRVHRSVTSVRYSLSL